jgi:hypothetical protein
MTAFRIGQRVIAKRNQILGGYYGHIVDIDYFTIVLIKGRINGSSDRHATEIGNTFPFHDNEIEAAD